AGIPADHFVNAVREDPKRRGLLYAATEEGVSVSFDDGDHWQSLQQNLPVTSVRDLTVHDDDLVIATHGRSFWILDDATPLRQLSDTIATTAAFLFQPATARRVRPAGFTGTPMPKDEPMAPNPMSGAVIDHGLAKPAGQPVTVGVRDPGGGVGQKYSAADPVGKADPARLGMAPQWVVPASPLEAGAGMPRFVWPLSYAPPPGPPGEGRGG